MAWAIEAVEKTAKKYPWLVYGGLAVAAGGGIYYLVKSRQGETGVAYAPGYPQEIPPQAGADLGAPAGTSPADLQMLEDLLNQLLWEQRQAGALTLQEIQSGFSAMYSQFLTQLPPAGAPAPETYRPEPPSPQAVEPLPTQNAIVSAAVEAPVVIAEEPLPTKKAAVETPVSYPRSAGAPVSTAHDYDISQAVPGRGKTVYTSPAIGEVKETPRQPASTFEGGGERYGVTEKGFVMGTEKAYWSPEAGGYVERGTGRLISTTPEWAP